MGSAGFEPTAFGSGGRMRAVAELRLTGPKVSTAAVLYPVVWNSILRASVTRREASSTSSDTRLPALS